MDRYRGGSGDRYGSTPDSHHYSRHSRAPPPLRASNDDNNPTVNYNSNNRRSPTSNYNNRGGFSGGGRDHNQFVSPPRFPPGGGGGFRPVGGDRGGFNSEQRITLTGQKRGFPFAGRGGSPEHVDGGNYAKLFVGSVPRTATEEEIRPLFEEHGLVLEVALIKDKRTGQQQGCCFIKYATSEEADRAIRALHNQRTLPGGHGPIQVRYADGERERLGALEYKLFVGSLNKQATEQEVEEMFSPYGRVDDVYLMRDEMKHSRGCGFVKFSSRETAMAAITALNGIYTMRGCDQPLTVRFADPKRPRPGESRGGPTFGGPGFGPRFQPPGIRPMPNFGDPMHGRIPPGAWNQISPQNLGPTADSGIHGVGSQFPRPGDMPMTSTAGDGFSGAADGPRPGFQVSSSSTLPQSMPQVPSVGQQISPLQRSNQSPQNFPPSLQLQPPAASSSQPQTPSAALGQLQMPNAAQTVFGQAFRLNGQPPASQPQIPQNTSNVNNLPQPYVVSAIGNQQQLPGQQPLMHQSPSQLTAQMLSQQTQALQAKFQSSQQTFSQLQQQLQQMQPSNQSPMVQQQGSQASKQQSSWPGIVSQTGANTQIIAPATDGLPSTPMASVVPGPTQAVALVKCNWTEHTSPDGYKYYYNSTTGESTWQMPEELSSEKQQSQQQLKSSVDQPQSQSNLQGPSVRQVPQNPQIQHQSQFQNLQGQHQSQLQNPQGQHQSELQNPQGQHPSQLQNPLGQHQSQIQNPQGQHPSQLQNPQGQLQTQFRHLQQLRQAPQASSYQSPGVASPQTNQDLGYTQLTGAASSVHDPTRYQQGLQAAQEWMWKNKPGGGA